MERRRPMKFVLYKRIDEDTERGEERLSVYVWQEDSEDKDGGRYVERFEKRAAALSRDNESDSRMQGQMRERILAIMCVDERLYTGAQNMESIVDTVPNLRFEQKIVRVNGENAVKRYRIDRVSGTSLFRFRNALETAYQESLKDEERV